MVAGMRGAPLVALFALVGAVATASAQAATAVRVDRSGYLAVGSDSLFYEVVGSGPAIVLIHDGLIHREIWDAQFSHFAEDHQVIRYDRRGYGLSSAATESYSNLDDLHRLFTELGLDSACVIGMSSGGRLAIEFTLAYPERVTALVLVGAVVRGFPYTQHFRTRGGHLPPGLTDGEPVRAYYAAEDPYEIYAENAAARERAMELVERYPVRATTHSTAPEPPPAVRRLHEIEVPTLLLVGEYDIPDVHAHAGAIAAGIAGAVRQIVPSAGHLIPLEQPGLFDAAVLEFLDSLSR